jgi:hypothetical protein
MTGAVGPFPIYSDQQQIAPYLSYRSRAHLLIDAGSVQLPLAYKKTGTGASTQPTARILQLQQPNVVIMIEWQGVRVGYKPTPVILTVPGSFTLAAAGAVCDSPGINTDGRETVAAQGYLVLYTANRPENIVMPSLLSPWDGRYGNGTIDFAYSYTPEELGFGKLLPGYVAPVTSLKHGTGNPVAQSNDNVMFL